MKLSIFIQKYFDRRERTNYTLFTRLSEAAWGRESAISSLTNKLDLFFTPLYGITVGKHYLNKSLPGKEGAADRSQCVDHSNHAVYKPYIAAFGNLYRSSSQETYRKTASLYEGNYKKVGSLFQSSLSLNKLSNSVSYATDNEKDITVSISEKKPSLMRFVEKVRASDRKRHYQVLASQVAFGSLTTSRHYEAKNTKEKLSGSSLTSKERITGINRSGIKIEELIKNYTGVNATSLPNAIAGGQNITNHIRQFFNHSDHHTAIGSTKNRDLKEKIEYVNTLANQPVNVNINIGKFQDSINLHTTNVQESMTEIEKKISGVFVKILDQANNLARQ